MKLTLLATLFASTLLAEPSALIEPQPQPTPTVNKVEQYSRITAIWGSMAMDMISTHQALKNGAVEANPIYGGRYTVGKYVALNAPVNGLLTWFAVKHPNNKAGKIAGWVASSVRIGVSVSNWRNAGK